ncbi:hypothetical protein [Limnohabitans planktonicus]|uniref:hypothetical protein n=1 Tax=Limnohabitans planktonicus TaxID=540060 RepID=UPI000AAD391D|nr:hypothetical protein [Limnohabitans planktonicus]
MQHPREKCVAVLEAFLAMLTKDEVAGLLAQMEVATALLAGGTTRPLDLWFQV